MILDIIAEDATWYFLVIFTSHFVLVLTLNLARVSIAIPLAGLQSMTTTAFSPASDPTPSGPVSRHHPILESTTLIILFVTAISGLVVYVLDLTHTSILMTDVLSQVSSHYDIAYHAIVEESHGFAPESLVPHGANRQ